MSIQKLPNGKYLARVHTLDGRQPSKTCRTLALAREWEHQQEEAKATGTYVDPRRGRLTLTDYTAEWLRTRTVKGRPLQARTVETYRNSFKLHIEPEFGALPLSAISTEAVAAWYPALIASSGQTAARQAYAFLKVVTRSAARSKLIRESPCQIEGAGLRDTAEREFVPVDDAFDLIDAMPEHLQTFAAVALWAGLRHGELLGLQWGDLDLDAGVLNVRRQQLEIDADLFDEKQHVWVADVGKQLVVYGPPKAGSGRVGLRMPAPLVDLLTAHRDALDAYPLPTARVFTREDGSLLRSMHTHPAWRTARAKVGLPGARIHDMRHTMLTAQGRVPGTSRADLQAIAGHKSPAMVAKYQHSDDAHRKEIADGLGAVMVRTRR